MELIQIVLTSCLTVLSLGMILISILSYRTSKNKKLLFVGLAFLILFLKGIWQSISLFTTVLPPVTIDSFQVFFDVLIVVILFGATLKR